MKQEVTVELAGGKRITFETGRLAKQASGSALVTSGDNVVLARPWPRPTRRKASTSSR
jgi:polyribonucleotide nucleotidyltransferase